MAKIDAKFTATQIIGFYFFEIPLVWAPLYSGAASTSENHSRKFYRASNRLKVSFGKGICGYRKPNQGSQSDEFVFRNNEIHIISGYCKVQSVYLTLRLPLLPV